MITNDKHNTSNDSIFPDNKDDNNTLYDTMINCNSHWTKFGPPAKRLTFSGLHVKPHYTQRGPRHTSRSCAMTTYHLFRGGMFDCHQVRS